jgi:regulatory protein
MPTITQILPQKRRQNRRNIHLDGQFAFGCNINVVAKFHLREGLSLTPEQIREIQLGEVKQECFDRALRFLETRLHGRSELSTKLMRHEYGQLVVQAVLDDLTRMSYLDDERFAREFAASAAGRRQFGRRRTMMELMRKGIDRATAERALDQVYESHDDLAAARRLIEKKVPSLRRLPPQTARRRLAGQLLRRGFDYETIRPLIHEMLGDAGDPDA